MTLSPIDRVRLRKAAVDEGFGIDRGEGSDWLAFDSIDAPASLRLTRDPSGYIAATNHNGVATDLATHWQHWSGPVPDGFTAFIATNTTELHVLVREMWRLARSLPIEPLRAFEAETRNLPRTTEAERVVVQRVGQSIFRDALMEYWGGACAVLGVAEPRLLRASHIVPWSECDSDAERLNVHNGLLLAAHLDAAFDAYLISFSVDGQILRSPKLSESDAIALGLAREMRLRWVDPETEKRLVIHRMKTLQEHD